VLSHVRMKNGYGLLVGKAINMKMRKPMQSKLMSCELRPRQRDQNRRDLKSLV
jgi:hypothetical protein